MKDGKIRVVVVDDSPVARRVIATVLSADDALEIVGTASDGSEAVGLVESVRPDIVLMDMVMPVMDGLAATSQIMDRCPCPILLVTGSSESLDQRHAFEAIALGALDVVAKPELSTSAESAARNAELIRRVKALSSLGVLNTARRRARDQAPPRAPRPCPEGTEPCTSCAVAIASSTGGPAMLSTFFSEVDPATEAFFLVTQHVFPGFDGDLVKWLSEKSRVPFTLGGDGQRLRKGTAVMAPAERHMELLSTTTIALNDGPPVRHCKPSADVMLKSVAKVFGARSIGVILSGMGDDGAAGLEAIKEAGGRTVAQDEATCAVFGMPRAAIRLGVVDDVLPMGAIAGHVQRLLASHARRAR